MGYSLQRPRAPLAHGLVCAVSVRRVFQWATHFNAHAHHQTFNASRLENSFNGLLTSTPTRTALRHLRAEQKPMFQWATHFNAHAHANNSAAGLRLRRVSMGYSLQRPRAPVIDEERKMAAFILLFQWATHFNAHAHIGHPKAFNLYYPATGFQWATHFNAHAHAHPRRTLESSD